MTLSNRSPFLGALYHSGVRCSYLPGFLEPLLPLLERPFKDRISLADDIDAEVRRTERSGPAGRVRAADLTGVAAVLRDSTIPLPESEEEIEDSLRHAATAAQRLLRPHGFFFDSSSLHIVDSLPSPYDRNGASAVSIDLADHMAYGIDPGVYMLRKAIRPFYSQALYLHELIHTILGEQDPDRVAHGLEEGLADLIGAIWLAGQILGPQLTYNIFVLNRLSSHYTPFWEHYLDTARRLCLLYVYGGQERLLSLLRSGRAGLYAGEAHLPLELGSDIQAPIADDPNPRIIRLAIDLLIAYPRSFVVSPEAFLFASNARSGLATREISAASGLSADEGEQAASELRNTLGALFMRKDNIVVLEGNAAHILAQQWLRYRSDSSASTRT